ncbi:MAG: hypothetical protein M3Q47_04670 [Actinomycetota bacterium]|nr:hypothetical protein [Actinomycetota bacterium]
MTDRELGPTAGGSRSTRPVRCVSRAAGHAAHPVHLRLCHSSPDDDWSPVIVMGAVGDVVTLACGEELRRHRNHDTGRLLDMVAQVGPDAMLNLRYGLLFLRTWPREAGAVFSLQAVDHLPHPCAPAAG